VKSFLRTVGASLLCVCLLTFSLWRYDAFPDMSGVTAWLKSVKAQADNLIQATEDILGGGEDGGAAQTPSRPVESGGEYTGHTPTEEVEADLLTVICEAYDNHDDEVDLSAFGLTATELKTVISGVRYSYPEYFYVDNAYSFSSNEQTQLVTTLCPSYLVEADVAAEQTSAYRAKIKEIAAGVSADASDFEKVLYLHDHFVQNYCYDYTYTIRDAYRFFEEGTGVCQAYMLAFIAVAEEIGIRSVPVTSTAMNHAWNLVEVDGEWYHLDITWDDSTSYPSFVSYAYFLQSDNGIYHYDVARTDDPAEIHHDWTCAEQAESSLYDAALWRSARTPMAVVADRYFCVIPAAEGTGGVLYGGATPLELSRVMEIDGVWRYQKTNKYYPGCYVGIVAVGGELIYNTDKTLRAYDPQTGKDRILTIPSLVTTEEIYGILLSADGATVTMVAADLPTGEDYRLLSYRLS
jgi:hypothetical protein